MFPNFTLNHNYNYCYCLYYYNYDTYTKIVTTAVTIIENEYFGKWKLWNDLFLAYLIFQDCLHGFTKTWQRHWNRAPTNFWKLVNMKDQWEYSTITVIVPSFYSEYSRKLFQTNLWSNMWLILLFERSFLNASKSGGWSLSRWCHSCSTLRYH